MGANDRIADAVTKHIFDLEDRADAASKEIVKLLRDIELEILAKVKRFKELAGDRQISTTERRAVALLDQVREILDGAFLDIADGFSETLAREARREIRFVNEILNEAIGVDFSTVQISKSVALALATQTDVEGKTASEWWSEQPKRVYKRFVKEIRKDFATGKTAAESTQWIAGTKKNKYKDGMMAVTKSQAEALARTAMNSMANNARMEAYKENADLLRGYVQISQIDERTTDICLDYAGAEWTLAFKPIPPNTLPFDGGCPRHFNCRSVISPLLKTWDEIAGRKLPNSDKKFEEIFRERLAKQGFNPSEIDDAVEEATEDWNDTTVKKVKFERLRREQEKKDRKSK